MAGSRGSFNSKEYAWIDVKVVVMGKEVTGMRGVEYKLKRQKAALFATGKRARGIQMGKKEYDGTFTMLQSELIALNAAAIAKGYDDVTDLEFDAIVSYLPENGIIQTDKIVNMSITEAPYNFKEGDLQQEHALPFIACDVEPNVI
jgi:UDP-N-acetylglucosamine enolpyruvyl transferase